MLLVSAYFETAQAIHAAGIDRFAKSPIGQVVLIEILRDEGIANIDWRQLLFLLC